MLPLPLQVRYAERFLRENQVPEPEQAHISGVLNLIASPKPSARLDFPGGELQVSLSVEEDAVCDIYLTGPTVVVAEGEYLGR